ncbi:Copine-1, variant 2, partial [Bonamia ostreae]
IKKNLNPYWKPFKVSSLDLCDNNYNEDIRLRVWDYDKIGKNDLIGEAYLKVNDLKTSATFDLKIHGKSKSQGKVEIGTFKKTKMYCFDDYLKGGLCFTTIIAIDFSEQNKPIRSPDSLHYLGGANEYESAFRACAQTIANIDSDQKIPVWGFSARLNGQLSRCFSLTFNPSMPKVNGVQEVIDCYRNALNCVSLGSPKELLEVLNTVKMLVEQKLVMGVNEYFVLFIFVSPGDIADIAKVKDMIVELSDMPLSVIFVGIGAGDFSKLSFLDDGWRRFRSSVGKKCLRDSVDLIRYRSLFSRSQNNQIEAIMQGEIYKTITEQSLEYFKMKKMVPGV